MLIDIGANLTHDSFDHDVDDVLRRAYDAGVTQMIVTGASMQGSEQARTAVCHRRNPPPPCRRDQP